MKDYSGPKVDPMTGKQIQEPPGCLAILVILVIVAVAILLGEWIPAAIRAWAWRWVWS